MKLIFKRKPVNFITLILGIGILIYGWFNVYELSSDLKTTVKSSYLNAQLNIVKIIAMQIEKNEPTPIAKHQETAQDIQGVSKIIKNSLLKIDYGGKNDIFGDYGVTWLISGNSKYTNLYFPVLDITLDISDYFNINSNNKSIKHYEKLLALLKKRVQGVGWYINYKDKSYSDRYLSWWQRMLPYTGETLVTFTSFEYNGKTWLIGMNTLLPKLMQARGAYSHINKAIFQMLITTIIIVVFLIIIQGFSLTISKLNKKFNLLKIEIDKIHKEQRSSEIIDSEYFKKIKNIADKL